jgi:hypothetical protein
VRWLLIEGLPRLLSLTGQPPKVITPLPELGDVPLLDAVDVSITPKTGDIPAGDAAVTPRMIVRAIAPVGFTLQLGHPDLDNILYAVALRGQSLLGSGECLAPGLDSQLMRLDVHCLFKLPSEPGFGPEC